MLLVAVHRRESYAVVTSNTRVWCGVRVPLCSTLSHMDHTVVAVVVGVIGVGVAIGVMVVVVVVVAAVHGCVSSCSCCCCCCCCVCCCSVGPSVELYHAAGRGDMGGIRRALTHGASPFIVDQQFNTPLHLAAGAGHLPCVKVLLDAGAARTVISKQGFTPADRAAINGHPVVVKVCACCLRVYVRVCLARLCQS